MLELEPTIETPIETAIEIAIEPGPKSLETLFQEGYAIDPIPAQALGQL